MTNTIVTVTLTFIVVNYVYVYMTGKPIEVANERSFFQFILGGYLAALSIM